METHSSREGINGSHRRLLKGILWCNNSAPTDYQKSWLITENNSTGGRWYSYNLPRERESSTI